MDAFANNFGSAVAAEVVARRGNHVSGAGGKGQLEGACLDPGTVQ